MSKYIISLRRRVYFKYTSMLAIGESRHAGKIDGTARKKIYSFNTYRTYLWKRFQSMPTFTLNRSVKSNKAFSIISCRKGQTVCSDKGSD